jgi:hypothetical protein
MILLVIVRPPFKIDEEEEYCLDSVLDDDPFLLHDPPCEKIVSHLWEDGNNIEALDDPIWSLDDSSIFWWFYWKLCINMYIIMREEEVRGRPLYVPTLLKLQASSHDALVTTNLRLLIHV